MERFGEKISAEACSGSGFTEEDENREKLHMSGFSRVKPEAGI